MENIYRNIILSLSALVAAVFSVACSEKAPELQLDGDTWLTELSLDGYEGSIDRLARTVTVSVPETYDASAMKVTSIEVSEGASASVSAGDVLNMDFPQTVTVTNGDAYLDFAVTAVHDYVQILSFSLDGKYTGSVDNENRTVTVKVPTGTDVTAMSVSVIVNEGATITPASGTVQDFSEPVKFVVRKNTAEAEYVVTVIVTDSPSAVYVGLASSSEVLNPEEKTAVDWMLANVPNAMYVSFDDIIAGAVDLSECKVMWWHLHIDGGIDTKEKFEAAAPQAVSAMTTIRDWWKAGGNLFLTRYASFYAAYIGAAADGNIPNNCWGGSEQTGEITTGAWSFFVTSGHENHPLYDGIEKGTDTASGESLIYTCDTGYRITNSTAQWHIGADWGGYADLPSWREKNGAIDLGHGGDGAVVVWEYPAEDGHGAVLCIGSGCFDWYAYGVDASDDRYHGNVSALAANAFNYLSE